MLRIRATCISRGGHCNSGLRGLGALLAATSLTAGAAQAQTASQITPPSFAPPAAATAPSVTIPDSAGATAPPGAELLEVTLADVVFEGAPVEPRVAAELRAGLVGRRVNVSEIFAAAQALEARFAGMGRVLVRVVVPAQQLADGAALRLAVVDGFIERVDTSGAPSPAARRIAAILAPLVGRQGVRLAEIERRLLLAADMPGVEIRSTLIAGDRPGATVLVVEATHRPVSGFVTMDNTLSSALGRYAFGAGLTFNSVLGAGETIYLRASGLPNTGGDTGFVDSTPRNRALAAGVVMPLGHDGLMVNVEASDARTAPRHGAGQPGFASVFRRLSGRIHYPFVRSRSLTLSGGAAFDAQDERVEIIDPLVLPLFLDKLRVARATGDLRAVLAQGGVLSARVRASFGIDALGARSAAEATPLLPLSRAGAGAEFQKADIEVEFSQPLAERLVFDLGARAQSSFGQALANSEQIGIATLDGISPLPAGTLQGDAGYVLRGEVQAPFSRAGGGGFAALAPYIFAAYGGVRIEAPTAFERGWTGSYGYGAGIRLTGAPRSGRSALFTSVEYGRAHHDGLPGEASRLSFAIIAQF